MLVIAGCDVIAARALRVADRGRGVGHRDRRIVDERARRRASARVHVLRLRDQPAIGVGPVDRDVLDLRGVRRRDNSAFDGSQDQAVGAGRAAGFGCDERRIARREVHVEHCVEREPELHDAHQDHDEDGEHESEFDESLTTFSMAVAQPRGRAPGTARAGTDELEPRDAIRRTEEWCAPDKFFQPRWQTQVVDRRCEE